MSETSNQKSSMHLLVVSALLARTIFLFLFLSTLYYYIPAYKIITVDFPVKSSACWRFIVSASDWLVIQSPSDALFPILLVVFLVGTLAASCFFFIVLKRKRPSWVSFLAMLGAMTSLILCGFLCFVTIEHIGRIVDQHPQVLDSNLWYINLFAGRTRLSKNKCPGITDSEKPVGQPLA